MFQGYKEVKESRDPYEVLEKAWQLYDIDTLNELTNRAKKPDQYNIILDHMYQYDATRVNYYKDIERKIIERMW
jgi:hypothetical protein